MKKFMRLLLSLLIIAGSYAADLEKRVEPPLNPEFSHIFELLGHPITTVAEANEFAQKHLLRRGERWDLQEETSVHRLMKENEAALISNLNMLGILNFHQARESAIARSGFPKSMKYDYALLMGALKDTVLTRLNYLARLIENGYSFNTIALLGGKRTLLPEEKEGLPEHIQTEAAMMTHMYQEHPHLKYKKILLIDAPMIKKKDGTLTRPTTDSTLEYFAQVVESDRKRQREGRAILNAVLGQSQDEDQKPSCMVISNGQYIIRQMTVAARILAPLCIVDADGPDESDASDIVMLMDEFARFVYEANRIDREELNKK